MEAWMKDIFYGDKVRRVFDQERGKWLFSVVDFIQLLLEQPDNRAATNYWSVTKKRLKERGHDFVENCTQVRLKSRDDKMHATDVMDMENLFYLIQFLPSDKTTKFQEYFAKSVIDMWREEENPELIIERAIRSWKDSGKSDKWISERLSDLLSCEE